MKSISSPCKEIFVEKWQNFLFGKGNAFGVFIEQILYNTNLYQQYNKINVVFGNESFQKAKKLGHFLLKTNNHYKYIYLFSPIYKFRLFIPYIMKCLLGNFSFVEKVNKPLDTKIMVLFDAWREKNLLHPIKYHDITFELWYIKVYLGILSSLAIGIAMDINKKWNPIGYLPFYVDMIRSVRVLVPIANHLGFYWGRQMKF
jgi:hypothetical protein